MAVLQIIESPHDGLAPLNTMIKAFVVDIGISCPHGLPSTVSLTRNALLLQPSSAWSATRRLSTSVSMDGHNSSKYLISHAARSTQVHLHDMLKARNLSRRLVCGHRTLLKVI